MYGLTIYYSIIFFKKMKFEHTILHAFSLSNGSLIVRDMYHKHIHRMYLTFQMVRIVLQFQLRFVILLDG